MTSVQVKICGIMDAAALEAAVQAGADYVGFVFAPASRRFVSPQFAERLCGLAEGEVKKVGLFVDPSDEDLKSVLRCVPLDMIQLHGHETTARVDVVREVTGLPVIKAVGVAQEADLLDVPAFEKTADMILLDAKTPDGASGGLGLSFDWRLLTGQTFHKPWMLAGGLTVENVAAAIETTGARLVDVSSGVERYGEKDAGLIRAFIENAKRWR